MKVDPHHPIEMTPDGREHWIECECGWISSSYTHPSFATVAHQVHAQHWRKQQRPSQKVNRA